MFEEFGRSVSDARRAGDAVPTNSLFADTSKLIGNSCYGKTIVNKDKHQKIEYVEGHVAASRAVASPHCLSQ